MHSISCLLECVSEMVQHNYLKSFKSKSYRQSVSKSPSLPRATVIPSPKCSDMTTEDVERIYSAIIKSDAENKFDFQECEKLTERIQNDRHYPAKNDLFYLQPDSECVTINECKMNEIFDTYLHDHFPNGTKNQEIIAVEQLLDVDRKLEQELMEMREKYKEICLKLEAKKAMKRLQEVNRDMKKEPMINLGEWMVHLPHAMNRLEKEKYVNYLLQNVMRDLQDINNVAMGELLDDDVITTVMEACQNKHSDILFVNPCITQCIQFSTTDDICSFLDPIDAKKYDNLFFVINDTSNGSRGTHWSLLLLNKQTKTFCHYDSLKGMNDKIALELSKKLSNYFEIWQIIDIDCEQQTNNTDCGIYVLDNMLRIILVLKNDVNVDDERITVTKIAKLPPSFTKTRIYMMNTYISSILEKVKRTLRVDRRDTL